MKKITLPKMNLDINFPVYHGRISAAEAKKRLLLEIPDVSAGKYLVRLCGHKDYVISFLTKKLTVKHLLIPEWKKNGNLYQFNPQIKTLPDKVNFLTKRIISIKFSHSVSYLDFNNEDILGPKINRDEEYCKICDKSFSEQKPKTHRQKHILIFCRNCGAITQNNHHNYHKEKC